LQITPEYLAGFFDGEGTFYIGWQKAKNPSNLRKYPHASIMLSQSGEEGLQLFEDIQTEYGGSIYKHLDAGQHKATKPAYKIYWNKEEGVLLIKTLLPFLRIKKQQAEEVLSYLTRE